MIGPDWWIWHNVIFKTPPPPSFLFSLRYLFLLPSCLVPLPDSFVSLPCPFIPSLPPSFPLNVFTSFLIFSYTFIFSLHFLSDLSSAVCSFLPSLPLSSPTLSCPLPCAPPLLPLRCYPTSFLSYPHFSSPLVLLFPSLTPLLFCPLCPPFISPFYSTLVLSSLSLSLPFLSSPVSSHVFFPLLFCPFLPSFLFSYSCSSGTVSRLISSFLFSFPQFFSNPLFPFLSYLVRHSLLWPNFPFPCLLLD